MTITFVDTSAIYALLNERDPNYAQARRRWNEMLERQVPLVTSSYTITEVIALTQRRMGIDGIRLLAERILPALAIEWADADNLQAALTALMNTPGRRNESLTDHANMILMRELGILAVFAYDKHYAQQGIQVIG